MAAKGTVITAGDVFEIATPTGFAQFQALFFEARWGHWIRVFAGGTATPLADVAGLAGRATQFCVFFPATQALRRKLIRPVGHRPLGRGEAARPRMKSAGGVAADGTVLDWFIVDGSSHRRTPALTDAERRLPDEMVVNDTALVEMIADGWTHDSNPIVRRSAR